MFDLLTLVFAKLCFTITYMAAATFSVRGNRIVIAILESVNHAAGKIKMSSVLDTIVTIKSTTYLLTFQ